MAASSVNNISANFGSCSSTTSSSSSAPVSLVQSVPSVTWNPQLNLRSSLKASFVGLYGSAGPQRSHFHPSALPLRSRSFPLARRAATCALAVGDKLPNASLSYIDKEGNVQIVDVSALTKGKKVVLFAVPGAFTPTCTQKHLPGFVELADAMKAKGIDTIACIAVNDVFVLRAWGDSLGVGDKVLLLSDGNGHFTSAMGVTLDLSDKPVGLGLRSRRYSLLAEDGVIKLFNLEDGGAFSVSAAEDILKVL